MNITQFKNLLSLFLALFLLAACNEDDPEGNGQVSFKVQNLLEVENATIPLAINVNIDNPYHGGGTINIAISGGAYGTDFETSAGSSDFTIDVAPNVLLSTFSISPIDDELVEEDLPLTVTITAANGNLQLGEQTSIALTIIDDEKPPEPISINFAEATMSVSEGDGAQSMTLLFSEMLTTAATISLEVDAMSTATFGTDFSINGQNTSPVVFSLLEGATEMTFDLELIDDMDEEDLETIVLALVDPSAEVQIGASQAQIDISLFDNDGGTALLDYLENFETNDGTSTYLNDVLGYENILVNQTIDETKIIKLANVEAKFSDEDDPTLTSDNGLNIFYNSDQDPTLFGELDNVVISPELVGTGVVTTNIDVAYGVKAQNNGVVTFYWSETYDGSGTFNEADWNVMGTETADGMSTDGFGNNAYKRENYTINPTQPFYLAARVTQTIDDVQYRTQWRFDNWRVFN